MPSEAHLHKGVRLYIGVLYGELAATFNAVTQKGCRCGPRIGGPYRPYAIKIWQLHEINEQSDIERGNRLSNYTTSAY